MINKRLCIGISIVTLCALLAAVFSMPAFAADGDSCAILLSSFCDGDLGGLLKLAVNIFTGAIVVAATIGIIWTGRIILMARDDVTEVAKAKKRFLEIVIGLVCWFIVYAGAGFFIPGFYGSIDNPTISGLSFSRSDSPSLQDMSQIKPDYGGSQSGSTSGTDPLDDPTSTSDPTNPSTPSTPSTPSEPGTPVTPTSGQNTYNGMTYFLNVPQNATTNMPLMIWLHGRGETANPSAVRNYNQTQKMFARTDFISLVPVAPTRNWEDGKLGTLKAIIDGVVSEYKVNKNKIYIWGFSMGGRGTYYMLATYPGFFKAAVVVSNCCSGASYANVAKTPVYTLYGSYEEGDYGACVKNDIAQINAAGGNAAYQVVGGQTHSTISYALDYNNIFNWMLSK